MAIIRFAGFGGENRALHPMLLPETVGVTSTNQKPGRGDLRPWKAPSTVATVPSGRQTIYRMGRTAVSDTNYWLSWPGEVHVVCAPNAADTAERTYFTGSGTPKWTNTTIGLAGLPSAVVARELGVPAPTAACALAASGAAAVAATALVLDQKYTITTTGTTNWLAVGADNEVVSAGSFVVGTAYTIKTVGGTDFTLIGASANTVGISFSATGVGTGSGTASKNSMVGVTFTATAVGTGTGTATASNTLIEDRYYSYTCVTDFGEESAPNPAPTRITCKTLDTVTISGMTAPSGSYGINRFRVYRTQASSTGGGFYFLRETSAASTTDDGRDLGEVLPTTTWTMPPTDLTWLTGLWNGMMAGISGRSVRFCEAYTFYAWPVAYEILPTNAQPVALATFGQTLVMLTNGNPSIITGGTPDAMDEQPVEFYQACIAPLSVVGVGHGVVWASPDGLAYVGTGGPRLLTGPNPDNAHGIMTRDDWQEINPGSIKGCLYERRYIGFYTQSGVRKAFVYDFNNPQGMYFMDFGCDALYLDDIQDTVYVLDGINVQKWDAGALKTVTVKSKLFKTPKPVHGFACAEVVADAYPVSFKLYADGALKHTQTVANSKPFRLPGGYFAQSFQMEVSATSAVQGMAAAHSMAEIAKT